MDRCVPILFCIENLVGRYDTAVTRAYHCWTRGFFTNEFSLTRFILSKSYVCVIARYTMSSIWYRRSIHHPHGQTKEDLGCKYTSFRYFDHWWNRVEHFLHHQRQAFSVYKISYPQVSNIRRTKSHHLKDSNTVLRLSLPNPLKPDVKSRMKM